MGHPVGLRRREKLEITVRFRSREAPKPTYLPQAPREGGGGKPSPLTASLQIGERGDVGVATRQIPVVLSHLSRLVVRVQRNFGISPLGQTRVSFSEGLAWQLGGSLSPAPHPAPPHLLPHSVCPACGGRVANVSLKAVKNGWVDE